MSILPHQFVGPLLPGEKHSTFLSQILLSEPKVCSCCGTPSRNPAYFPKKLKSIIGVSPAFNAGTVCIDCVNKAKADVTRARVEAKKDAKAQKKALGRAVLVEKLELDLATAPEIADLPALAAQSFQCREVSFCEASVRRWSLHIARLKAAAGDSTLSVRKLDVIIAEQARIVTKITGTQKKLIANAAALEVHRAENLAALTELIEQRRKLNAENATQARALSAGTSMRPQQIPQVLVETKRMETLIRSTLK
jgi:hypothetical protein